MSEQEIFEMVMRAGSLSVVFPDHQICWSVDDVFTWEQVVVTLRHLANELEAQTKPLRSRCERGR